LNLNYLKFPPLLWGQGGGEISLKELAKAYTGFANNGRSSEPYYISKIEDGKGNLLVEFKPDIQNKAAYTETTREIMIEMMKATVNEGTATRLRNTYGLQNDIAGKTGTTQSNKDGWFVGLTPKLLAVTWVGSDDHRIGFRNTGIGQGANSALPIFALFLQKINEDPDFSAISNAKFGYPSAEVVALMDCEASQKDGFFDKLFGKSDKKRDRKNDDKKKKGFFNKLFGKKKKNQ